MAEETEDQSKSSGGGKGLMIVLIALVVVLLLAVVGGAYFLYSQGVLSPKDPQAQEETTAKKEEAGDSKETFKAEINDLVLNITNSKGREKLMKLSFAIKSVEPSIAALVENYRAEIIDVVIRQISARSSEELLTVGGKALLKEELIEEINSVLNEVTSSNEDIKANHIKQILFTTFVIK
ncbi:flagellar basal body-associated FliL family protein [Arcobacter sp. YIC-464]|uniref:flagellar basal body-associated FliL family protein n=1 Tax=Arcobacter sp. YIC-464 TaxID=3376631 RepID=UPI003C245AD7